MKKRQDCVYQAFKKVGYEYPEQTGQTFSQIMQFCEDENLDVYTEENAPRGMPCVVIHNYHCEKGYFHAEFASTDLEYLKLTEERLHERKGSVAMVIGCFAFWRRGHNP